MPCNEYSTSMGRSIHSLLYIVVVLLVFVNPNVSGCLEQEREALLRFKQGLLDPTNRLSSWVGEDCCIWDGVGCQNATGHVVELDLRNTNLDIYGRPSINYKLAGKIDSSLVLLQHLMYLDLSGAYFDGIPIPKFLGSFEHLRHLNLSYSYFIGRVPSHLGNLSNLLTLDLKCPPNFDLTADDLAWLSPLSCLQYLDLSSIYLTRAVNWQQEINMLSSLTELHLASCRLQKIHSSFPFTNLTSINVFDLRFNHFNTTFPLWLANFSSLTHLYLSNNDFTGPIPSTLGNLSSLEVLRLSFNYISKIPRSFNNLCNLRILELRGSSITGLERGSSITGLEKLGGCLANRLEILDLSWNRFTGYLPYWLEGIRNLKNLDLGGNSFSGSIPPSIGRLSSLEKLSLRSNELNGYVPQDVFGNLSNLEYLDVSNNSLTFVITEALFTRLERLTSIGLTHNHLVWKVTNSQWLPPNIKVIDISSCQVGPNFPLWLQHHKSILKLGMSNVSIEDVVPDWFWNIAINMQVFDLSHNQIKGKLLNDLELGWGMSSLLQLDLSNNSFSGPIPEDFGRIMPSLQYLKISNNILDGNIPSSFCIQPYLETLDLSSNHLQGNIPDCWQKQQVYLNHIRFSNNNLSGDIPKSLGDLPSLASLHLRNNSLSGELPSSMKKLKYLVVLDLDRNRLSGSIPTWVGENLTRLRILSLRSNMIHGSIPSQISYCPLQFLDLSHNKLSGTIPRSFGNMTLMAMTFNQSTRYFAGAGPDAAIFEDEMLAMLKGLNLEISKTLGLRNLIDLSVNNLSGDIPEELTHLLGLVSLNLSSNRLKGNIPNKIGALTQLESLDLSKNTLSGEIPSSLSLLSFLSTLNLSYNNLSGEIPSGGQMDTFLSSTYVGNENLCGPPLLQICPEHEPPNGGATKKEKDDQFEMLGFFVSLVLGFIAGFWVFCGILIVKRSWRNAYYRFMDECLLSNFYDIMDKVIVTTMIWFARIKRKVQKPNLGVR